MLFHNIALVFSKQRQYDKALEWYERALAGKEKALGVDNPDTLTVVHSIAMGFTVANKDSMTGPWNGMGVCCLTVNKWLSQTISRILSLLRIFDIWYRALQKYLHPLQVPTVETRIYKKVSTIRVEDTTRKLRNREDFS